MPLSRVQRRMVVVSLFFLLVLTPAVANAGPFGLSYFQNISAGTTFSPTNGNQLNLQQLSFSQTATVSNPDATATVTGSITGSQLHGYSFSQLGPVTQTDLLNVGADASTRMDLYWFDTFNFPAGTETITMQLDGTVTQNAPSPIQGTPTNSYFLLENCTYTGSGGFDCPDFTGAVLKEIQGSGQYSVSLVFPTPTTVVLGSLLQIGGGLFVQEITSASGTQTIDDSNTAFFTISGPSFTTASGLTYSAETTPVPEPGSWVLLSLGLLAAILSARHRARNNWGLNGR
jgi:hypothetical protein